MAKNLFKDKTIDLRDSITNQPQKHEGTFSPKLFLGMIY